MINTAKSFKLYQTIGLSPHLHTPRRTTGYWLAGFILTLTLLPNLDLVVKMLDELILILLEWAGKALVRLFEMAGFSPRLAQVITAYTGFIMSLILAYGLVYKIRRLLHQARRLVTHLKAESRDRMRTTASAVRASWMNLPWHKKLLLAVAGISIFVPLAITLSTTLGMAIIELL